MSLAAAKKRRMEVSCNGLVILEGRWWHSRAGGAMLMNYRGGHSKNHPVDVTDILQFWTTNSRLYLPIHEGRWWHRPEEPPTTKTIPTRTWAWNWLPFVGSSETVASPGGSSSTNSDCENAGRLEIRYRYHDSVYEIVFEGDELIWLPNERATRLGPADRVQ